MVRPVGGGLNKRRASLPDLIKFLAEDVLWVAEAGDELARPELLDALKTCSETATALLERLEQVLANEERASRRQERQESAWQKIASKAVSVESDTFDPRGYFVYLLWGDDPDTPLYVGQSQNVLGRLGQHHYDPEKRDLISRVQLFRCANPDEMDGLEKSLIREYQPPLNARGCESRNVHRNYSVSDIFNSEWVPPTLDWAPIPGFPGYEVSVNGEIRNRRGRLLKQRVNKRGLKRVDLGGTTVTVARCVLRAFTGEPAGRGFYPFHLNGDKSDNSLGNLAWAGGHAR